MSGRDETVMRPPDPVWLCAPACVQMPVAGRPHAGGDRLSNGIPVADLALGQNPAGRDVVLEVSSRAYLQALIDAARDTLNRLGMYPGTGAA